MTEPPPEPPKLGYFSLTCARYFIPVYCRYDQISSFNSTPENEVCLLFKNGSKISVIETLHLVKKKMAACEKEYIEFIARAEAHQAEILQQKDAKT